MFDNDVIVADYLSFRIRPDGRQDAQGRWGIESRHGVVATRRGGGRPDRNRSGIADHHAVKQAARAAVAAPPLHKERIVTERPRTGRPDG